MSTQDQINQLGAYLTSQIAQINGRFNLLNAYCDGLEQQVESLADSTVKVGVTYYDQTDLARGGEKAEIFQLYEVNGFDIVDTFALGSSCCC